MNICHVDLRHAQTTKTTANKTKTIQGYLGGSSVQKSTCSTGIITPVRVNEYVVCTAGEFFWNEGGVVPATCYLQPGPYITMCDFN